jgi:hypothetical protein
MLWQDQFYILVLLLLLGFIIDAALATEGTVGRVWKMFLNFEIVDNIYCKCK